MPFTQKNRLIAIDTPLGEDALLLSSIQGNEGVSTPFSFELDLLSANNSIKFKDIIGKNVTVSIVLADGEKHYFNGLISRFAQGPGVDGGDIRLASYSATMVPWLWLLTRTADSRIFQNLSVPEIVEKIFKDLGFLDFKLDLGGSYDKRNYCVQCRETDFNFVSRLFEEEGIFYFFAHEKKKHTLVIADVPDKHKPCPKQEEAWCELTTGGKKEKDMIEHIEVTQEITAGKYTLNDFNFETPGANLKVDAPSQKSLGPGEREIYDYPGGFDKRAGGDRLANIRMEEEEAEITTISGSSRCRAFTSGYKFTLKDYYRDDMTDKDYVLVSVSHSASQGYSPGSGGSELAYSNIFTCIPYDVPYRPSRVTPKPVVEGVQTAIVVGPSGEEIHTDEHGRVKVQFHWDREGNKDDKSSCWIRVSQLWAGAGWGAMHIPHVGHEVIVDFLEGDPDRPIITGRVYHGTNKPPEALPGGKTKSAIRDYGNNETIVEGKDGSQCIHTKQACGNEFKMDGSNGGEKIELRDKYGNEVVLDAVEGIIRIFSPTHNSEIVLGRSCSVSTDSHLKLEARLNKLEKIHGDKEVTILGNVKTNHSKDTMETLLGAFHKNVVGITSKLIGGWKQETIIGAETKFIKGAKREVIKGTVYKEHVGMEYKKAADGGRFKAPTLLQIIKDTKEDVKNRKIKVEQDSIIDITGDQLIKAEKQYVKAKEIHTKAESASAKFDANWELIAAEHALTRCKKIIQEADEMKVKADTAIKGNIKLG